INSQHSHHLYKLPVSPLQMDTPDFRSFFLIKLAKTLKQNPRDLVSTFPDSCPGLSAIKRRRKDFDNGSFGEQYVIRKTLGDDSR
ncbi:Uncharacterized protein FKW44_002477, partial [Caligus rogercresseyi]